MFSHRQRVARVRRLAMRALDAYPLVDPQLRFIADEENTTFRVDATAPDERGRFLLRVRRPATPREFESRILRHADLQEHG
jgi:hypothetical protein